MHNYPSVSSLVQQQPIAAVQCFRASAVHMAAQWFLKHFPGQVLFAVKTNPEAHALRALYAAGIRHFDVASLPEVQLVAQEFPDASMYFMHTVKSREAIAQAYFTYGVRDFSLDTHDELEKILSVTGYARDIRLHVRLGIPNTHATHDLSGKFGVHPIKAAELLTDTARAVDKVGMSFHVGSQCMDPSAYTKAITMVGDIVRRAGVELNVLDVGGGFPSCYMNLTPPPLKDYMAAIREAVKTLPKNAHRELWCEPGRALVAESGSVLARVELRKGNMLYINDGTYGGLFDAGSGSIHFPAKAFRLEGKKMSSEMVPYEFYGPTCDSIDYMPGPFYLPADIREGDYIEIGQLGAYSSTLRTRFNGFYSDTIAEVEDKPMLSMYRKTRAKKLAPRVATA